MLKNIAMLLDHSGRHDSRVLREAEILRTAGYQVTVFCLNPDAEATDFSINDILFVQCHIKKDMAIPYFSQLRKLWQLFGRQGHKQTSQQINPPSINSEREQRAGSVKRALGWFFIFSKNRKAVADAVRAFKPQIIHAHDLFMLPAGAYLARHLNCKLIYDSHEYERSRNDPLTPIENKLRMGFERKFIQKADEIITVSDSIAAALARDYKIKKPSVFLNIPLPQKTGNSARRSPLTRKQLGLPENVTVGIYTGAMTSGRGVDIAIAALPDLPELHLALLGHISEEHKNLLLAQASQNGVSDRCHFLPPVAESDILPILQLCDFSWIPIQNTCLSYNYSLPNKLFQSYEAGLPVFATPLYEIRCFVEYFKCGSIAKDFDAKAQAEGLEKYLKHLKQHPYQFKPHPDYTAYQYKAMQDRLLSIYKGLENPAQKQDQPSLPHYKFTSRVQRGQNQPGINSVTGGQP